jgi:hypothetical protein
MKTRMLPVIIYRVCILFKAFPSFGQTSWKVTTHTNQAKAIKQATGVSLVTTDVITGDANFTGRISATFIPTFFKSLIPFPIGEGLPKRILITSQIYLSHQNKIGRVIISKQINMQRCSTTKTIQLT